MVRAHGIEADRGAGRASASVIVFAVIWTSGDDPASDTLLRIQALRIDVAGGPRQDFDVNCVALEGQPTNTPADLAWSELESFARGAVMLVANPARFSPWRDHFGAQAKGAAFVLGLTEVAALFLPGRLAGKGEDLVALLASCPPGHFGPIELRSALEQLARSILGLDAGVLKLAARGLGQAARAFALHDASAAARLAYALAILDRPGLWCDALEVEGAGRLLEFAREEGALENLLDELEPRCAREAERWMAFEPTAAGIEEPLPFDARDSARLDEIFQRHLPHGFSTEGASSYRPSQHAVAREVARTLGTRELLLVHAPTGTGKTLAYLVPALLWSRRHDVRVGIATYTRALQEQALDREVPRALEALALAGVELGTRVALLKGRDNYLCWRAVKSALPENEDGAAWLAWTTVALFALTDLEGDFDRLPRRAPIPLSANAPYQTEFTALVNSSRARTGCCTNRADRAACAAESARRKAERSHVVIVNHAFALARPEFLRHVVFDECEHLHEQAHNAWSSATSFREMRAILGRLTQPGRESSRAVLDRMQRSVLEGTPSWTTLEEACAAAERTLDAIDELEEAVGCFVEWRTQELQTRESREAHSLLREYAASPAGEPLLATRTELTRAGSLLETHLAELSERLDQMPVRRGPALRRALDIARTELDELRTTIEAWIPLDEGSPAFRPRTFHDVESDARGQVVLSARVLLPNEFLGRGYYPTLVNAVFLSATTWLQDGFSASRAYLGLDRAAQPAPDEQRMPCVVRTFRAPEVFDYSRVLVAIPRDVPPAGGDKAVFLGYVRRFIGHLAERTRGRMLVLFTNAEDVKQVGQGLLGFFRARSLPLWFQNMEGIAKEELSVLFRARIDSTLLGVDTFWYGADFPGETLEHLVIVKLPYGVPDAYHHAQCAVIGTGEQRRQLYLPRALGKFRQGFGRLMRRVSDRGCVYVLDQRVLDPRHRFFLRELPLDRSLDAGTVSDAETSGARLVRGDTDRCVRAALAHMGVLQEVKERGLDWSFHDPSRTFADEVEPPPTLVRRADPPAPLDVSAEDLPF